MPKQIVDCADVTWMTPMYNSNVYRPYKALTVNSDQANFCDGGVGTGVTGLEHVLDGAFGQGMMVRLQIRIRG